METKTEESFYSPVKLKLIASFNSLRNLQLNSYSYWLDKNN